MRVLTVVFLVACGGQPPGSDTNDPTDPTGTNPTTTVLPGTDEGSVFLLETAPHFNNSEPNITLAALFVEDDMGYENLAQCVAFRDSAWCADRLPTTDGDYIVADSYDDDILAELVSVDVGPNIKFGPYTANKYETGSAVAYFETNLYGIAAPASVDLIFGTQGSSWGVYTGVDIVDVPDQMVLTNPSAMEYITFEATKPVELRWEPGATGDVYIAVLTWNEARIYKVADDGEYDLDLDDLGLYDGDSVEIRIGRWGTAEVDNEGHELTIHYQRDQKLFGSYHDFGGRTEIFPPNTCNEAGGEPALEPGNYWGDLAPLTNNNGPGFVNSCTGFPAIGADGVYTLEVNHNEIVDIRYELPSGDASVYLLETCGQSNTCLVGADTWVGIGTAAEEIQYHNQTGQTQYLSLVLDAAVPTNSLFTLDITSTQIIANVLVDNCVSAMGQGPIGAGNYVGDLNGFTNILDPGPFTGLDAAGPEGLIQIELQTGQTLQADVNMPGHDAVLYVLYNCSVAASIGASADANVNGQEQLVYVNQSLASELVYLVVDGVTTTGSYTLDVVIQ